MSCLSSREPQKVRFPTPVTQGPSKPLDQSWAPWWASCISFNQYLRVESLIFFFFRSCPNIPMLECSCQNDACTHLKCFVLFLQGQLRISALPLSQRKDPGRGPASLLGHLLGPCPGSSGFVKNPGIRCRDTEDQVLQVKWRPPHPLKLSGVPRRGVGMDQHLYSHPTPSRCSAPSCRVTGESFLNTLP